MQQREDLFKTLGKIVDAINKEKGAQQPKIDYNQGGYTGDNPELFVDFDEKREWTFHGKKRTK